MFEHLLRPLKIGTIEVKNRIKLPALGTGYVENEHITPQFKAFYRERAKGGAGFIGFFTSPTKLNNPPVVGIYSDEFIPELKEMAALCHDFGAKVYAQMGGGYAWCFDGRTVEVISPSGVTVTGRAETPFNLGGPPRGSYSERRALTVEEIAAIIEAIAQGARRAREAGFDAVEILAGVGYYLGQFLSPLTNRRTDGYGGDLRGRTRIFREIFAAIKETAGADFPITCRLSGQFTGQGIGVEDLKAIAREFEAAGVQAIDILPGWHEDPVPMIHSSVPQGRWAELASEVKAAVNIPVGAGTRISDPRVAEEVIASGKADYVYMARALIADPEVPEKIAGGRLDEIRPCIACNYCFESLDTPGGVVCSVNPRAGREGEFPPEPAEQPRKVVVVGGGPAGMTAAATAARRGHSVILYEKGELGGQLLPASRPPHKAELESLRRYLEGELKRSGVEIRREEATPEAMARERPDVLIVASGAEPERPPIPGAGGENVLTPLEVLLGEKETADEVAVVGGGLIGCETAEFLAWRGKKVTLLARRRLADDVGRFNRWHLLQRLREAGVRLETGVDVKEISPEGVKGIQEDREVFFPAKTVVLATGMRPRREPARELEGKAPQLYIVGDAREPRRIREAIHEGFRTAFGL